MKSRLQTVFLATMASSVAAVASPANAAVGLALLPSTLAVAATGLPSRCEAVVQPANGLAAPVDLGGMSKSQAILGGKVSALEAIAMQQAASSQATLTAAVDTLPGSTLAPSAGGFDCQRLVLPQTASLAFQPGLVRSAVSSDDFLASKRLAVKRTAFDAAWNRVRQGGVQRQIAQALVREIPGPATSATLRAVNSWTNANVRYVEDSAKYGQADYWADARSTLRRKEGDCEDIAIAKMQLLAALGVSRSDMYLTIARDLARNADHALLVVKLEGRSWLLDNNTSEVLDANLSYDYRPILSFSGSNKWLHGYETFAANVQ